jgi:nucleoside-diphosphate-sugar epimerase
VFHHIYGLPTVGLRYFNVFGPRQDPASQYAAVVPLFITRYLAGIAPIIHGDGGQTRDFTYIRNVVAANIAAAAAPAEADGRVFNIACGDRVSVKDLCHLIRDLLGSKLDPQHDEARVGDVRDSQADIALARRYLGWEPSVQLATGLADTVAWYRQQEVKA